MGFSFRLLQLLAGKLLYVVLLLGVLFAIHLAIRHLLPELEKLSELSGTGPQLSQALDAQLGQLQQDEMELTRLRQELESRSQQHLKALRQELGHHQARIAVLTEDRAQVLRELAEARELRDEYCESYNPIKLWFCREMRARYQGLTVQLDQLQRSVERDLAATRQRLDAAQEQVTRLANDPEARLRYLREQDPGQSELPLRRLSELERRIDQGKRAIAELRQQRARVDAVERSVLGFLWREWTAMWPQLALLVLGVVLLPYVQRTLCYFVLMPLVHKVPPLRLCRRAPAKPLRVSEAQRSLKLRVPRDQVLLVRPEYARPVHGKTTSQWFFDWRSPAISYSAGMVMLTRIEADSGVTLAAPEDPDMYLARLDLTQHPGVVIHPRNLVAVLGDLKLRTVWKLWNLHAWSTFQVRFVLLSGTGSVILEGAGDVKAESAAARSKIEQPLVVGFEGQLAHCTGRTETFLPYLFGRTPLVDDVFEGEGQYFWQKSTRRKARGPVDRGFDALFGAVGKLLGL